MKQHYSPDEADAILGRAVKGLPLPGDLTREQLLQTAREVGVSPEQLEAAEAEYRRTTENQEFWAAYRAYRMRKALVFLPVLPGFVALTVMHGAGENATWAPLGMLFAMLIGFGAALARTASCRGTSRLGERKLRKFIEMRRRMGLSVPPNLTFRDY